MIFTLSIFAFILCSSLEVPWESIDNSFKSYSGFICNEAKTSCTAQCDTGYELYNEATNFVPYDRSTDTFAAIYRPSSVSNVVVLTSSTPDAEFFNETSWTLVYYRKADGKMLTRGPLPALVMENFISYGPSESGDWMPCHKPKTCQSSWKQNGTSTVCDDSEQACEYQCDDPDYFAPQSYELGTEGYPVLKSSNYVMCDQVTGEWKDVYDKTKVHPRYNPICVPAANLCQTPGKDHDNENNLFGQSLYYEYDNGCNGNKIWRSNTDALYEILTSESWGMKFFTGDEVCDMRCGTDFVGDLTVVGNDCSFQEYQCIKDQIDPHTGKWLWKWQYDTCVPVCEIDNPYLFLAYLIPALFVVCFGAASLTYWFCFRRKPELDEETGEYRAMTC